MANTTMEIFIKVLKN